MLKLFLLRHAKSRRQDSVLNDFDRPLKKSGIEASSYIGNFYSKRYSTLPDLIISSPAARALETANLFAKRIGFAKEKILLQPEIYEATCETLLTVLRKITDKDKCVVMVGHNPGFTELANSLIVGANIENIPTAGFLEISLDISKWKDIDKKRGKLICFEF